MKRFSSSSPSPCWDFPASPSTIKVPLPCLPRSHLSFCSLSMRKTPPSDEGLWGSQEEPRSPREEQGHMLITDSGSCLAWVWP